MKIVIVDGQGGKLGKLLVEQLKQAFPQVPLYAIGTNSIATATMLRAGADFGATGENPVVRNVMDADVVLGLWGSWWPTPFWVRSLPPWRRPWAAAGPGSCSSP